MSETVYSAAVWAKLVKKKYNFLCSECGSDEDVQAVHVIPPSFGGRNILENGITRCLPCRSKRVIPREVTRFNFSIPSSLMRRLETYCLKSGRSASDVVKQVVADCAYDPTVSMNGYHKDAERNDRRMSVLILSMVFRDFSKKCVDLKATPGEAVKALLHKYLTAFEEERT
jgi:metal-responsive CopG/Arc/MetJ family transcriptional regulator